MSDTWQDLRPAATAPFAAELGGGDAALAAAAAAGDAEGCASPFCSVAQHISSWRAQRWLGITEELTDLGSCCPQTLQPPGPRDQSRIPCSS